MFDAKIDNSLHTSNCYKCNCCKYCICTYCIDTWIPQKLSRMFEDIRRNDFFCTPCKVVYVVDSS